MKKYNIASCLGLVFSILSLAGCDRLKGESKAAFDWDKYPVVDKDRGDNNSTGRFQLVQLGGMARDQFLLDSVTGRVWRAECSAPAGRNGICPVAWIKEQAEDFRK